MVKRVMMAALVLLIAAGAALAFIDTFRPETLGSTCQRANSITVFKVEKFNKEKRLVVFRKVKDLKGEFPREVFREFISDGHEEAERKHYLDWVGEGKTVVVFRYENRSAICIGDQWTVCDAAPPKDKQEMYTVATRTEPWFLKIYCGDGEKLAQTVADILDGKEVVVPAMVGDRDKELRKRTGEMVSLRASLKRKDYNLERDRVPKEKEN